MPPFGSVINGRMLPEQLKLSSVSTTMTLTPMNSVTFWQPPLGLAGTSSGLPLVRSGEPRRRINTSMVDCRRCSTCSGNLADFDELIIEQTGNTGRGRVIIINMLCLPERLVVTWGWSLWNVMFVFVGRSPRPQKKAEWNQVEMCTEPASVKYLFHKNI